MGEVSNPAPRKTTQTAAKVSRAAAARALFLSLDFFLGVMGGAALGYVVARVPQVQEIAAPLYLTVAGVCAAIAALVLTPMTTMLTAMPETLRTQLRRVSGGVAGVLTPFVQVTTIAACGVAFSLAAALLAPLAKFATWALVWPFAAAPLFLALWAVSGCVQVTRELRKMVELGERMDELVRRREAAERGPKRPA